MKQRLPPTDESLSRITQSLSGIERSLPWIQRILSPVERSLPMIDGALSEMELMLPEVDLSCAHWLESPLRDLNPRPSGPKPDALSTELRRLGIVYRW
jgi:hypothetical protein